MSIKQLGFPPTAREVAEQFGWASATAAKNHLDALERKGYIKRHSGRMRGIQLLPIQ